MISDTGRPEVARSEHGPTAYAVADRPFLPALVVLFVGSGCAALIYEIVWFQMLQLVIGSTGVSLGVLLGSFMGGMCLGSLYLPRRVSAARHPLRVYAALEAAIAGTGLLMLLLIPVVGSAYVAVAPPGTASVVLRAVLAGVLLLPPTILMGATLPAIARYVEADARGVAWMGFFYGGNIAGAVTGCLLAGFYLLRSYDVIVATLVAVGINLLVAGLAVAIAARVPYRGRGSARAEGDGEGAAAIDRGREGVGVGEGAPNAGRDRGAATQGSGASAWPSVGGRHTTILVAIGLSGFVALGSEVVWTRLMALLLGATTYTFSIILAVFLAALGIGSSIGAFASRHTERPRVLFGMCQAGAVVGIAWTAHALSSQLPYWPINPSIALEPGYVFQLDMARAFWALLPAPLFWGASFPLAVSAAAERGQDPAELLGRVYAANTVGAILGALLFGVVVIAVMGTQNAQRALVLVSAASALVLLLPLALGPERTPLRMGSVALGVGVALWLSVGVATVPPVLIAYGRYAATYDPPNALYVGEGRNSSIAVTELSDATRNLHIGGKVVASTEPQDMRLQGMLGHLTALLHDDPKSVLIVGFGAGVTAGTFVTHPGIDRIVIAEIEPLVVEQSSAYEQRRARRSARRGGLRRRPPLPADVERDLRSDHLGPDPSVDEGCGGAVQRGVLRAGERAPERGRGHHPVGAAVREQRGRREERDRHLLPSLSGRHGVGQHVRRRRLRCRGGCDEGGTAHRRRPLRRPTHGARPFVRGDGPLPGRLQPQHGPARYLRGEFRRPDRVALRCGDQS